MNSLVSPVVYLGLPVVWLVAVYLLIQAMMVKQLVNVKFAMRIYNVTQIVVCGYMVWGLFPCLGLPNFCGINSEFDARGEWFVFVHYLSKYLDWFDTLWIILNKKRSQLSFLHIYHHATIGMVWGLLLDGNVGSGTVRYGAWINSLTHVIMYSHYLWTSFGLKNPFKKYITMWQISQFYSCLVHAFLVLFLETTTVHRFAWLQVIYQSTMVYLFSFKLSYVPSFVPAFGAKDGEKAASCSSFFEMAQEEAVERQKSSEPKKAAETPESASLRKRPGRAESPGAAARETKGEKVTTDTKPEGDVKTE